MTAKMIVGCNDRRSSGPTHRFESRFSHRRPTRHLVAHRESRISIRFHVLSLQALRTAADRLPRSLSRWLHFAA